MRLTAWRLVPSSRAGSIEEAFSGLGSYLYGQRWNLPGRRIVYLSSHLSLAALEVIVHAATYRDLGTYSAFRLDFDDTEVDEPDDELPVDWNRVEPTKATQKIGSRWAASPRSRFLRVPSAVVPNEHNYLLDVDRATDSVLAIEGPISFRFDPRLEGFNR